MPVRVAYNQWTQFDDFPSFMKKVESVDAQDDGKSTWKAQVFWSHRSWESQVVRADRRTGRILWRSKGEKGSVDGAVTFHEVGPDLTRVLLVLEYHPQGLFEHTGNIWRAQGRRARLEFKHFRRHVMTQTVLDPDEVEGWRGEIEDSQVVKDHETALQEEQEQREREEPGREEQARAEEAEEEPEEEREERRPAERGRRRPPQRRRPPEEEEYDAYDEGEDYDEGYEEEEPEEEEQPAPRRRQPERARRQQPREEREPREEPQRPRPAARRAPEPPRRPVVRRRREERGE